MQKCCFISVDEIYVKSAVRCRGNHIIELAMDQDNPRSAKTAIAFMVNFMFGTSGFITQLLPLYSLNYDGKINAPD